MLWGSEGVGCRGFRVEGLAVWGLSAWGLDLWFSFPSLGHAACPSAANCEFGAEKHAEMLSCSSLKIFSVPNKIWGSSPMAGLAWVLKVERWIGSS